jgi:hypothetical protein
VFALAHGADKSLFYYGDWIKTPGVAEWLLANYKIHD